LSRGSDCDSPRRSIQLLATTVKPVLTFGARAAGEHEALQQAHDRDDRIGFKLGAVARRQTISIVGE